MPDYKEKVTKLCELMDTYAKEDIMLAFSGGADSGLLLKLACEAVKKTGHNVYAVFLKSMLHPAGEEKEAEKTAREIGAKFMVVYADELEKAGIEYNPEDRCYRCKKYLFQMIIREAQKLHINTIMEGTNQDDLFVYRPGIRAVKELGIISPLAISGFTKSEVRKLAGEYKISVSDKPAAPCLATRFPYGTKISYEEMHRVDDGERFLRKLGFYNVRLRVHDDIVRIEVDPKDISLLFSYREKIVCYLKELGYSYITVDLEGFRSGSMDLHINKE